MAYKLATSVHYKYDFSGKKPFLEGIQPIIDAGFKNLDFNFLDMVRGDTEFLKENYMEWIFECKEFAEKNNVHWVQAHATPVEVGLNGTKENFERNMKYMKRSLECCGALGIKWAVFHHVDNPQAAGENMSPKDFNLKFFTELLEVAQEHKVGIAIENTHYPFFSGNSYADGTYDLIDLVDTLGSEYAGICWDVGHANLNMFYEGAEHLANQSEQLKLIGDRLKATHIHDNNAKTMSSVAKLVEPNLCFAADEHIQPFMGTIDWDDVIYGLDSINYSHYFTYEAHNSVNRLPDEVVSSALIHLRKVGESLIAKSILK